MCVRVQHPPPPAAAVAAVLRAAMPSTLQFPHSMHAAMPSECRSRCACVHFPSMPTFVPSSFLLASQMMLAQKLSCARPPPIHRCCVAAPVSATQACAAEHTKQTAVGLPLTCPHPGPHACRPVYHPVCWHKRRTLRVNQKPAKSDPATRKELTC
eukprot:364827-Chlamydomonas_euryale.AAC.2